MFLDQVLLHHSRGLREGDATGLIGKPAWED